jgi:hypothetical protein
MNKKTLIILVMISMLFILATQAAAAPQKIPVGQFFYRPDFEDARMWNDCRGEWVINLEGYVNFFHKPIGNNQFLRHVSPASQVTGIGENSGDFYILPGTLQVFIDEGGLAKFIHNGVFVVPSQGVTNVVQNGICR